MRLPLLLPVLFALSVLSPAQESPVRVMTFNIRYANPGDGLDRWELRRHLVAGVIQDRVPGIVGLQEALSPQLDWLGTQLPEYDVISKGRDLFDRGERCALFVRRGRWVALTRCPRRQNGLLIKSPGQLERIHSFGRVHDNGMDQMGIPKEPTRPMDRRQIVRAQVGQNVDLKFEGEFRHVRDRLGFQGRRKCCCFGRRRSLGRPAGQRRSKELRGGGIVQSGIIE